MSQRRIVQEFELGRRGTVRASLSRLSGKLYADLRLWVEPSPGAPLVPTKAGLTLAPDWLPVVRECLDALIAATLTDPPPVALRDRRPDPFITQGEPS